MNYTEPFLRKVETAQEEQHQHQPQSGVSYRAAVAAKKFPQKWAVPLNINLVSAQWK